MTPSQVQENHPRREFRLWTLLFAAVFVYLWQEVRPEFLYSGFGIFTAYPVFAWDGAFLREVLSTPGGPLNALAALLAQTYRLGWLGALTIMLLLAAIFVGLRRLLRRRVTRDLAWVLVLAALMIYTRYDDPLPTLLAIGLFVWLAVLYDSVPIKMLWTRVGLFLVLFALAYYLAGASALLLAAAVCLIEALPHRRVAVALIEVALAVGVVFVLGRLAFGLEPRAIFTAGTPWNPTHNANFSAFSHTLIVVLYASVPTLLLVDSLANPLIRRMAASAPQALGMVSKKRRPQASLEVATRKRDARSKRRDWLGLGARALILVGATALCLAFARNHLRDERALHYYSQQRHWSRAVALAHRMQSAGAFTRSAVFDINRALGHEARSGDELCAYPQDGTKTLFLGFHDMVGRFQHAKLLELYLDLGCPNAAEKNAYELLDNEGPSPHVLEALVRIHLAKGERESAKIALAALKKYAGAGPLVRRWQPAVTDPAKAESDPLIRNWRHVRGTRDYAVAGIAFEPLLKTLLQETPDHRLAFEYLMAHFLLTHQRDQVLGGLPLLASLGYKRLPRHYAEAVLVHSLETRTPPDARGWTIEPDVYNGFRRITAIAQSAQGDSQAVFDRLAPQYSDTYTFYSLFNTCGLQ